jgi:hypothetical protein
MTSAEPQLLSKAGYVENMEAENMGKDGTLPERFA